MKTDFIEITKKNDIELFYDIQWVSKARSKDGAFRKSLCCISVEDNNLVCTDGHRIHVVSSPTASESGLESGLWEIVRLQKTIIWLIKRTGKEYERFPKWAEVLPNYDGTVCALTVDLQHPQSLSVEIFKIFNKIKAPVNTDFIRDALILYTKFFVYTANETEPILFSTVDNKYRAWIMAMRLQ